MGEGDRAEPLERLLNLVGLLLETPQPLSFEQIRRVLEPYGQSNPDTAKRMFERDKDVLREYGVPLELVEMDVWGTEQGYVIPKDKYYLPEIEFEPGELVALLVAAQSGGQDPAAESGARKLLYGADGGVLAGLGGGPLASGSDARSNLVHAAAEAAQELRRVRFPYRTSQGKTGERDVDAWAMVFRAGHWYLVGHDRERDDVRAFRLSRIAGEITDAGSGTAPPADFRAADHVDRGPWVAAGDDRAVVLFSPDRTWFAASQFPGARENSGRSPTGGWRWKYRWRTRTPSRRCSSNTDQMPSSGPRPRCATPSFRGWRRSLAERKRGVPKTSDRLGRMLAIVPYLVQHPGSSLKEVASAFDVPAAQLRRDLDLLFMSGLPPYGPGDLIDVDVDEDGHIWISMADHFSRPLQLTRIEALAVYLRGTELLATPGMPDAPSLAKALEKLRRSLGAETLQETDGRIEIARGGRAPEHLDVLLEAARTHERLSIEYFAASTGEWSQREIAPEEVFSGMGHWYVAAWDVDADAERLFRADRMRSAEPTGETFTPRGLRGAGRDLYSPTGDDVAVRLRLRPAARWIAEYYATTDVEEREDGGVELTLPARQLGWVARLLLRVGDDAEVVEPPELRDQVRDLARETLAGYRHKT